MKLSIAIPCYNECGTIKELIERVNTAEPADKEIVVVDDCSNDGTADILVSLPTRAIEKLIRLPSNQGKRAAPRRVLYFWHRVGNSFLTLLSNMFTNLNLTDMETCCKAFRSDIIKGIEIEGNRFSFKPEITAKVVRLGCRVYEVGISYHGRTYAEGKEIGWKDGIKAIYCIIKYRFVRRQRPGR